MVFEDFAGSDGVEPITNDGVELNYELDSEMDEQARIEAAIRAGEAAAEADFAADARRAAHERDALASELVETQEKLAEAQNESKKLADQMARLQADWENFRRRTRQERALESERAAEKVVVALLPAIDDLERALDHASGTAANDDASNDAFDQFVSGVAAVHEKIVDVLVKQGVEVIDPLGEQFDPLSQQAVGRVEDAEQFCDTVAQVYQKGYRMGGKVIRTAMVTVTFGGPSRPVAAEEEQASDSE